MSRNDQNFPLSDDDLDELYSENELDQEDVKPGTGPFSGALIKPRHVTVGCRQLYGKFPPKLSARRSSSLRALADNTQNSYTGEQSI